MLLSGLRYNWKHTEALVVVVRQVGLGHHYIRYHCHKLCFSTSGISECISPLPDKPRRSSFARDSCQGFYPLSSLSDATHGLWHGSNFGPSLGSSRSTLLRLVCQTQASMVLAHCFFRSMAISLLILHIKLLFLAAIASMQCIRLTDELSDRRLFWIVP